MAVQVSRNMKIAAVAAVCVVAGGGTAFVVSRLNSGSASAADRPSALQTGVIGPRRGFGFPHDAPRPGFFRPGGLSAAAEYLGLSRGDLFARLRSGQTLAQVAESTSGKSVSGLVDAMSAAQKAELDAAVKDGRLTQGQADQLSAGLKDRIGVAVNSRLRSGFGCDD